MAGRGSRFVSAGYRDPKPLIPLGGKPMIEWVIENVRPSRPHRFTFICLAEHLERYPEMSPTLHRLAPGCHILAVDAVTEGAACTVLLARSVIDRDEPLMIANSDQYIEVKIDDYLRRMDDNCSDGLIMTFASDHPKWSYCGMSPDGAVSEVAEKRVISNEATVGVYNFSRGCDFVAAAETMIARDLRVNGEFYVAPVYNILIERGARIVTAKIGCEAAGMWGLGTPDDLERFMQSQVYRNLTAT